MSMKISRKDFLKGATMAAAGIGLFGVAGCGTTPAPSTASEAPKTAASILSGITLAINGADVATYTFSGRIWVAAQDLNGAGYSVVSDEGKGTLTISSPAEKNGVIGFSSDDDVELDTADVKDASVTATLDNNKIDVYAIEDKTVVPVDVLGLTLTAGGDETVAITNPVATYDCDVCVVGCGVAGLAACVSAAEQGLGVIGLEKFGATGGGGRGTEGVFAVGSQMQKDLGITVEPSEVLSREMSYHHNRVDGLRWMDLIKASGDNVAWLKEHGVNFTGVVDDYHGGDYETFHWFGENRAAHDYAPPMTAAAETLGVQILVNTPAQQLIMKDGKVAGVYAQKVNGDYIQVNAKAVIIGTGGFANNNDYLAKGHFYDVNNVVRFLAGFNGDGLRMVKEAGGTDRLDRFSGLFQLTVKGAPGGEYGTFGSGNGLVVGSHSGDNIWINERGERICAENSGDENWMALMIPTLVHEKTYSIFDRAAFEQNVKNIAFPAKSFEEDIAQMEERFTTNPYGDAFTDNTIEGLVKKVCDAIPEIEADTLLNTINHYNEMCRNSEDSDYGKPAKYLHELKNPPYYFIYIPQAVMVTFGGIHVNRKFECVDEHEQAIPGLYAVGVDSAELWPNVYTINVPGGTNANNVNSGRQSAINAAEYIGSAKAGVIKVTGDDSPSVVERTWDNPASLNDGTYTGTAYGMFGNITVTLTVDGGKITQASQTNELETSYIGVEAMNDVLIPAVINAQDVNVDTVAGATATSNGFRSAVENCLKQAAK